MSLPYLNLYIGDLVKDTDVLSPAGFGGYMRLLFKMHAATPRGEVCFTLPQLCRVFAASTIEETVAILNEIIDPANNIVEYDARSEKHFFVNRRMKRETVVSEARREAGRKGAAKTNSKFRQPEQFADNFAAANNSTNDSATSEAKTRQNYNNGIGNNNNNGNDLKGVQGENKFMNPGRHLIVPALAAAWEKQREGYIVDPGEEYHELRAIADKIAQAAQCDYETQEGIERITQIFETLVKFTNSHTLYATYQISQFRKYFNQIATACKIANTQKQQQQEQGKKSIIEQNVDAAAEARAILQRKRETEQV